MKTLLIISLLLITMQGFSQSIKATYTSNYATPPADTTSKPVPYIFKYEYNNGKSLTTLMSGPIQNTNRTGTPENIFYKDITKNIIKWEVNTGIKSYSVVDKLESFDWKIITETKDINGYLCTKATCVINNAPVIAWFCPAIKIPDGPLMYGGLPGLIIKITILDISEIVASEMEITNQPLYIKEPVAKNSLINLKAFKQLTSTISKHKKI